MPVVEKIESTFQNCITEKENRNFLKGNARLKYVFQFLTTTRAHHRRIWIPISRIFIN